MSFQRIYLFILLACFALQVEAYIGPGAGLSAIGSLIAFIGAVLLLIVGFFWYPIKRLLKGRNADEDMEEDDEAETNTASKSEQGEVAKEQSTSQKTGDSSQ